MYFLLLRLAGAIIQAKFSNVHPAVIMLVVFVYILFLSYFCACLVDCFVFAENQTKNLECDDNEKIELLIGHDKDEKEVDAGGRKGRKRRRSPSESSDDEKVSEESRDPSEEAGSESSGVAGGVVIPQPSSSESSSEYESSSKESESDSTGTSTDLTEDSDSEDNPPLLVISDSEGEEC